MKKNSGAKLFWYLIAAVATTALFTLLFAGPSFAITQHPGTIVTPIVAPSAEFAPACHTN